MSQLRSALLLACCAAVLPAESRGQELRLRRNVPPVAWTGCPPAAPPPRISAAAQQEAERLAADATQAAILGEAGEAAALLARAAARDPGSASIAYRLARAEHELGRSDRAVAAYCRYLALAPDAPDAAEIRRQVTVLASPSEFAVAPAAAAAFRAGLAHYDAARLVAADSAFGLAAATEPAWPDLFYNRGIVRLALEDREAAAEDLRRYLELDPRAPEFNQVLDVLGALRGTVTAPYNPRNALAAGLVVPGLGHFITDRAPRGAAVLGAAAAAAAVGLAVQRTRVECLAPPVDGVCPPDQILQQHTDRPYVFHGVGAAFVIGVVGAIDAYRGAQRSNAQAAELLRIGANARGGVIVAMPQLRHGPDGVRLELLRLRF
jgi:tetratricopeptide (TPR) repeat protein